MKLDHATVGVTAMNCVMDCFLVFGIQPFLENAERFEEVDLDIGKSCLGHYHKLRLSISKAIEEPISPLVMTGYSSPVGSHKLTDNYPH